MARLLPEKLTHKLAYSMGVSRQSLRPFVDMRNNIERAIAGPRYGEDNRNEHTLLNLLELARGATIAALAAQTPKASVVPAQEGYRQLQPVAGMLEVALNNTLSDLNYGEELAQVTSDALSCMGVMKLCLGGGGKKHFIDGVEVDPGRLTCSAVDLEDWVHDMHSNDIRGAQYMGDRFSMLMEEMMEERTFDKRARDRVWARGSDRNPYDDFGRDMMHDLSGRTAWHDEEYRETVRLWNIWLPKDGIILTCWADFTFERDTEIIPLRVSGWKGPEGPMGPYNILSFNRVPNNTIPAAPMNHIYDLHDLANKLLTRLGDQAERQKNIGVSQRGQENDARAMRDARDGELVGVDSPETVKELRLGGIDPNNNLFFMQLRDLFSYAFGNLDAVAGLSTQAETVGQERLISQSASKRMAQMQKRVVEYASSDMKRIGWWIFTDPDLDVPIHIPSPRGTTAVRVSLNQKRLMGRYWDYNFTIHPHSLQYLAPSERLQVVMSVWERFVLPALPLIESRGGTVDFPSLLDTIAKESNVPEIRSLVQLPDDGPPSAPVFSEGGDMREKMRMSKSPITTRRVVRQSQGTQRTGQNQMMQALTAAAAKGGKPRS